MKSEIVCTEIKDSIKYPKLMKFKSCNCVVLLWEAGIGVVIHADYCPDDECYYLEGEFSDDWQTERMELLKGIVKIQN